VIVEKAFPKTEKEHVFMYFVFS